MAGRATGTSNCSPPYPHLESSARAPAISTTRGNEGYCAGAVGEFILALELRRYELARGALAEGPHGRALFRIRIALGPVGVRSPRGCRMAPFGRNPYHRRSAHRVGAAASRMIRPGVPLTNCGVSCAVRFVNATRRVRCPLSRAGRSPVLPACAVRRRGPRDGRTSSSIRYHVHGVSLTLNGTQCTGRGNPKKPLRVTGDGMAEPVRPANARCLPTLAAWAAFYLAGASIRDRGACLPPSRPRFRPLGRDPLPPFRGSCRS